MSLPAALQPDSDSEDELPHGWEERTDEAGRVFFVKYVRRCRFGHEFDFDRLKMNRFSPQSRREENAVVSSTYGQDEASVWRIAVRLGKRGK